MKWKHHLKLIFLRDTIQLDNQNNKHTFWGERGKSNALLSVLYFQDCIDMNKKKSVQYYMQYV